MAHVIDVRSAGGSLVVLGDHLTVPNSNTNTAAYRGALRFNNTALFPEFYSGAGWMRIVTVDGNGSLTANTFISTASSPTPPFVVASNATVVNLNADLLDGYDTATGAVANTISVRLANASLVANSFVSVAATGTAPLFVSSNTVVVNLNADLLDGYDTALTATANTIAVRDANGDVFATLFQGTATSARYADVAERYHADAAYEPGTVLVVGGPNEVTIATTVLSPKVAGIVSTKPAYMMNRDAGPDETHPYVALRGRVPCKVVGPIRKGDLLVTSALHGHARAADGDVPTGALVGKALEDFEDIQHLGGVIEVMV